MPPPPPPEKDDDPSKLPHRKVKLSELVGPPPPFFTWARPARATYRIGYMVPPRARRELFLPSFLDIYGNYVDSLSESKTVLTRVFLLARFTFWGVLLARECYRHPFERRSKHE